MVSNTGPRISETQASKTNGWRLRKIQLEKSNVDLKESIECLRGLFPGNYTSKTFKTVESYQIPGKLPILRFSRILQ